MLIQIVLEFAENLDITADSDVDLIEKEGFHFFNVTGVHVKFTIGGLKLNMGNLFDGHRLLGRKKQKTFDEKKNRHFIIFFLFCRSINKRLFERELATSRRIAQSNFEQNHRGSDD